MRFSRIKLPIFFIILCILTVNLSIEHSVEAITEHTKQEFECMAIALHHEARGEGEIGVIAVANVIKNRQNDKKFPRTICKVVKQKTNNICQFTWYCDPNKRKVTNIDPIAYDIAYKATILNRLNDITEGALYFHNSNLERWTKLKYTKKIGQHVFYR